MAYLNKEDIFHLEQIGLPVIGLASDLVQHDSGYHIHNSHLQILYAPSGCMTLIAEDRQVILPPRKLLLIPAGVKHRVTFRNVVAYRSIYIRSEEIKSLSTDLTVLSVNSLLQQLIERIAWWDWTTSYSVEQEHILTVFWDELTIAKKGNYELKIPTDYRLIDKVKSFVFEKEMPPFLKDLSKEVGASEKTISRIFQKETGMSYQDWRLQWNLVRAIELLAEKLTISEIAIELRFSSDSAFIEFFKKHTGVTPNKYLQEK